MPRHVSISTKVLVSQDDLVTLLWNALTSKFGGAEEATVAIAYKPLSIAKVQALVRDELSKYGLRSVECGPRTDFYAPAVEARIRQYVSTAFKVCP